ncbi:MAG: transglutaminase-like cysteine peptidase [Anderseniella sp.]|nr:transglutaminase-like cysteine peptidase [Anderseniella sp.]
MLRRASTGCGAACPPRWQSWIEATHDLGGISRFAQLKVINWFVNGTLPYRRDVVAFGVADYWASPAEALRRGGDCEDFVALKYLALRQAGFPEEDLRVVVLQDLQRGQPHAVLVAQLDGINYVLDNQLDDLVADTELDRYRPVYSFNSLGKWVHLEVRTRQQLAMAN